MFISSYIYALPQHQQNLHRPIKMKMLCYDHRLIYYLHPLSVCNYVVYLNMLSHMIYVVWKQLSWTVYN